MCGFGSVNTDPILIRIHNTGCNAEILFLYVFLTPLVYYPLLGKIYVENERARLTHRLAVMKEEEGDLQEAAKILQELQVETYGSMERKEKVR